MHKGTHLEFYKKKIEVKSVYKVMSCIVHIVISLDKLCGFYISM